MAEIVKYELSMDKCGLLAILSTETFYHIHSDEMNALQQWIYKLLSNIEKINQMLDLQIRNLYER